MIYENNVRISNLKILFGFNDKILAALADCLFCGFGQVNVIVAAKGRCLCGVISQDNARRSIDSKVSRP